MKIWILITAAFFAVVSPSFAEETATPQEVFDMVVKGAYLLENLGQDGMEAFNDPNGELAWKDTYVQVNNCSERQTPGHPSPKVREFTPEQIWNLLDPNGIYIVREICKAAETHPNGSWIEYHWPKMGETKPSRKVTFVIQVPNTPWQLTSGIYDDAISLDELNSKWRQ